MMARLVETRRARSCGRRSYDNTLRSGDLFAIQSDVAGQVASAVAQPYGIIFKAAAADSAKQPPDDLDAYFCTLSFYGYRAQLSVEKHALLLGCLERAVARFPSYATAWAMLSIAYLDEDRFAFNHHGGSQTPLERSLGRGAARGAARAREHQGAAGVDDGAVLQSEAGRIARRSGNWPWRSIPTTPS